MLTFKRPGVGIPPYRIDKLIGHKAKVNIAEDTIMYDEMIEWDDKK